LTHKASRVLLQTSYPATQDLHQNVGEQGLHSKSWQQQRHHKSEAQSKQNDPTFKSSAARLETAPCLEIQFSRMQGVLFTKQISQVSLYKMVKDQDI